MVPFLDTGVIFALKGTFYVKFFCGRFCTFSLRVYDDEFEISYELLQILLLLHSFFFKSQV